MVSEREIRLGEDTYRVVAQPHARILRRLPKVVAGVSDLGTVQLDSVDGFVNAVGPKVHDVLKVFIPDLMPVYKFHGYATQAAMDAGEHDEACEDKTPTLPQIFEAFDAAIEVNGGDRLKELLGKALGPEVSRAVRRYVVTQMQAHLSQTLESSPQPSGESAPESSGEKNPATPPPALTVA